MRSAKYRQKYPSRELLVGKNLAMTLSISKELIFNNLTFFFAGYPELCHWENWCKLSGEIWNEKHNIYGNHD